MKDYILKTIEIPNCENEINQFLFKKCWFCGKNEYFDVKFNYQSMLNLQHFYCIFCVRNDFYSKQDSILSFSFINILSDIYFRNYIETRSLWLSEIKDLFENHCKIGLLNPFFTCDTENGNWFIDFSKINKTTIKEILFTTKNIITSFSDHLDNRFDCEKIYKKYKRYIFNFYKKRKKSSFVFSPALSGCGVPENDLFEKIFKIEKKV